MMKMKRGALIIFEGCDRSGKTTQCQRLVKYLSENLPMIGDLSAAKMMRFPDRETEIGKTISGYLKQEQHLDDHVVHLLFSANRWERQHDLVKALEAGQHVIVDRYAFSGVAFTAAKKGMSFEWCRQPDRGLPKPDLVCFLDVSPEEAAKRGNYGDERYEKQDFQAKVRDNYKTFQQEDSSWVTIDTDSKSLDEIFESVKSTCFKVINAEKGVIEKLWWPISEK